MIKSVELQRFKQIESVHLNLSSINVFVGGNNSGKSCILQGIHFSVALAQARHIAGFDQFPPEQLRYCPTDEFLNLCYRQKLHEGTSIDARFVDQDEQGEQQANVSLTRGRNGVVKAKTWGDAILRKISDPKGFFSIYVPGLAGIAIREEYRSELVVNNGIARGDANLFLRNLLLRIAKSEERMKAFSERFQKVFPDCNVITEFSEADNLVIASRVRISDGRDLPLDMVGTGILQAIQLIAYITMYQPKLLLLDEPDAHLHPTNQKLLAKTLKYIVDESDTKVLIATHSRHLLDAFSEYDDAKLFWVKGGRVAEHSDWADVAVLMDLGALDKGEMLLNGEYKYLIWTEDEDTRLMEIFLEANGLARQQFLIFSYQASSKIDAAKLMAAFLARMRPGVKTIIHRDRDFMLDSEVQSLKSKYSLGSSLSAQVFVTAFSDMEGYFASKEHLAATLNMSSDDARILIDSAIQESQNEFALKFQSKRNEIKLSLYKTNPDDCPAVSTLLPGATVPVEKAMGKLLLKKLGPKIQLIPKNAGAVITASTALVDGAFKALLEQ